MSEKIGLFSVCHNSDNVQNCCRNFSIPQLEKCFGICETKNTQKEYDECYNTCNNILRINDRFCKLADMKSDHCAELEGDEYVQCCRDNCIPSDTHDCTTYCKRKMSNPLKSFYKPEKGKVFTKNTNTPSIYQYIIYAIIILFIFLIIYFIHRHRSLRRGTRSR